MLDLFPSVEEGGPDLDRYQVTPNPLGAGLRTVWFIESDDKITRLGDALYWGAVRDLVMTHHNGVQED